jgi:hypothetical protein
MSDPAYRGYMGSSKLCPECGTDQIKALTPMAGSESAYLCENGHFFLQSAGAQPLEVARVRGN